MSIASKKRGTVFSLALKYGWICWYCAIPLSQIESPQIKTMTGCKRNTAFDRNLYWNRPQLEHIIPVSRGGTDDEENLALSCAFCNLAKGNCDLDLFLEWLDHIRFGNSWSPVAGGERGSKTQNARNAIAI